MPVLFQLFKIDDLKPPVLDAAQLNILKTTIKEALETPAIVPQEIRDRAYQVFQQLTGRPPNPATPPFPSQRILDQLFDQQDLSQLNSQQSYTLRMAIECEVLYSYQSLEAIKQLAYAKFQELTAPAHGGVGQQPQDPDALYSPFNPQRRDYPR